MANKIQFEHLQKWKKDRRQNAVYIKGVGWCDEIVIHSYKDGNHEPTCIYQPIN